MLALLTALAPLLVSLGLTLLKWIGDSAADTQAKQKAFLDAIQSHVNDLQNSINEKQSYDDQVKELTKN